MRSVFLVVFLLVTTLLQAQEHRFFTRNFQTREYKETPNKRLYFPERNSFRFEDYVDGKLDSKGTISGTTSFDLLDGFLASARSGNTMIYKSAYDNFTGTTTGFYHTSGKPFKEYIHRGKTIKFGQVWLQDGTPLLTNGTGERKYTSDKGNRQHAEIYKDSVLVSSYYVRMAEKDTIYQMSDKIAQPKEGYATFSKNLAEAIGYPNLALLVGKEGVAYFGFYVDEKGVLSEIRPLSSEGFTMEKRALKQLAKLQPWHSAMFKGRPVKTEYNLPIRYKIVD